MPALPITLANGRSIDFEIQLEGPGPYFLLGVRKCGSSVLNNMCRALCLMGGRSFVRVGETFFEQNVVAVDWLNDPALRALVHPGNIYGGFRNMPLALQGLPLFDTAPKLLMVRDPRDALVSEYFSNAYSHSVPDPQDGADAVAVQMLAKRQQALSQHISEWVLRAARGMNNTMMQYASLLHRGQGPKREQAPGSTLVLKYEDMIFEKPTLIRHLAAQFDLEPAPEHVADVMGWADQRPAVEDPRAFIRKVVPGDHREKLDRPTIEALNAILAPAMSLFGYAT